MKWKAILGFLFFILVVVLLGFYWFFPFGVSEFEIKGPKHSNFSLTGFEGMQFYDNMRYPSSRISYRIDRCPLQKQDEMERAFGMLQMQTILSFYPTTSNEEISVTCDSGSRIEGGMFIAGEGGPTNITRTEKFNVIFNGKVLLIRKSECENPNIALHELLHALGFAHSSNPNNVMYNVSRCSQTLGDDTVEMINQLYSYPAYPDLSFEEAFAAMHGRYLEINMTVRNNGLAESGPAEIIISADGKSVKRVELEPLSVGYGRMISLKNVWVSQIGVEELEFFIDSNFNELEKENNKITLKIKK